MNQEDDPGQGTPHRLIHPQGSPIPALGGCGVHNWGPHTTLGDTRVPSPSHGGDITSASHSSAEMLTKFISGDSTGVDCRKKVGKMED